MASTIFIAVALLACQASSVFGGHITNFIAGGKDAFPGAYPYQVSIQYGVPPLVKYRPVCGGAIINESWVLTSASCVTLIPKIGKVQIKAGLHELKKESEFVQSIEVILRLVHSGFDSNILNGVKPNDIALLKLKSPLQLNARVQPVTLPLDGVNPIGDALITGWGLAPKLILPAIPKVLQVANVTILTDANCNDALRNLINEKLVAAQFCTGPLSQAISACIGDLGTPLIQIEKTAGNNSHVLIGIASWFPVVCGQAGIPTVFTQVSSYIQWIEERINENE